MDSRGSWLQHASQALGQVITRSALNPLLWSTGVMMLGLVVLAIAGAGAVVWAVFALMSLVVLCVLAAYVYLVLKDPQALQSEEFRLKHQAIERIFDDRYGAGVDPEMQSDDAVKLIENPVAGPSTADRSQGDDHGDE